MWWHVIAVVGLAINLVAAARSHRAADSRRLNVRGAVAHLVTDVWAFAATLVAGIVIADRVGTVPTRSPRWWSRRLMTWTGGGLVRAAGRVFLEAAPHGLDPDLLGRELAGVDGVSEVHDLHIWRPRCRGSRPSPRTSWSIPRTTATRSARRLRSLLAARYGIGHVTLQADHADAGRTPPATAPTRTARCTSRPS